MAMIFRMSVTSARLSCAPATPATGIQPLSPDAGFPEGTQHIAKTSEESVHYADKSIKFTPKNDERSIDVSAPKKRERMLFALQNYINYVIPVKPPIKKPDDVVNISKQLNDRGDLQPNIKLRQVRETMQSGDCNPPTTMDDAAEFHKNRSLERLLTGCALKKNPTQTQLTEPPILPLPIPMHRGLPYN